MTEYVSPKKAMQLLGVSERTLRYWEADGKIGAIRTPAGHRRYDVEAYLRSKGKDNRVIILYSRVSSYKQRSDLERQVSYLQSQFPQGETVKEIGGGLNFRRKGLLAILGRVMSGDVRQVVVSHQDRLARFGVELIRWICEQNTCELLVLSRSDLSPEREMVEDVLAIIHIFSLNRSKQKQIIEKIKELKELLKNEEA